MRTLSGLNEVVRYAEIISKNKGSSRDFKVRATNHISNNN